MRHREDARVRRAGRVDPTQVSSSDAEGKTAKGKRLLDPNRVPRRGTAVRGHAVEAGVPARDGDPRGCRRRARGCRDGSERRREKEKVAAERSRPIRLQRPGALRRGAGPLRL